MTAPKKDKTQPSATVQNFPIVGIGASAGGLDAFKRLLTAIPEDSGMAYVLVQHLDPSHESILPEILQRVTKIPVHEITEDIHLAPDHIYIIPSNKILTSTDGVLQLAPREKKILNFSIDIFFTSLAEVHKEFAVGIVLSGTGSDGTLGLKAIKENGGISIAQDIESAAYDSMPQRAVNSGVVDFILAPEKIPAKLLQINNAYKTNHFFKEEEELPIDDEAIFKQILLLLHQRRGVDFTYYKQPTFHRRIARRLTIVKKKNLADYLKFLLTNKDEQDALFQDVLIPVTSFFRDAKTFQRLSDTVFPTVFKNKAADEPIRIWIAGCSTGEEAFSIAICLHEFLGDKLSNTKIQIFASDISEKAIKKARAAHYSKAEVGNISEAQLKKYFVKNTGGYELNKLIRDICVFAPHNFLKDPPFAKMDLISCRNVLIYMDTFLQKKAFSTFHYALRENGFLVLGKSETTGASSDLFTQISKNDKIYSRKPLPGRFMHVATNRKKEVFPTKYKIATREEATQTDFRKSAEAVMLSKSPASVVVNVQMDIVHIHGDITPFLQAPQGKPTHNLIKMAREGLAFELRNAIHKAAKEQDTVTKENIPVRVNGHQSLVAVEIIPLIDTVEPHYLIRFEKIIIPEVHKENKSASVKINATQKQNERLEKELLQTRDDMRFITEDMEAANEELQSANEELQSSNEEMQSLNEELETSKEELQSTNEELTIVNQELLDKQEQLNASRYYAESIVTTIREPLIILDKKLRIKTANASFYKVFNAEEDETEGKLFYEIQNGQWDDYEMQTMLEKILPQHERLVDFEIILKFPSLGERHLLLNALKIKNDKTSEQLILLAIEDITERKNIEQKLETTHLALEEKNKLIEASEKRLSNMLIQSLMGICIFEGPDMVVTFANEPMLKMWGKGNVIGKPVLGFMPELKDQPFPKIMLDVYTTGVTFATNEIKAIINRNGKPEERYFNLIYQPYKDVDDSITGVTALATEVTESVNSRKQIEESEKRFSNILSQSMMSIAILKGADLIIAFANEKMMTSWGKGNDIVGKPLLEVLYELKDQPFPNVMQQVYATGVPHYGYEEKAILIINGKEEITYYNYLCQPYTEVDNTISGVTILANEVTEQVLVKKQIEESEAKFRTLAESIPNMIWAAGADGQKNFFNKYFLDYTGLSFEELQEDGMRKIIFPGDLKKDLQLWNQALKTGEDFNMEKRIRCHDGTYRWHLSHSSAQKDTDGNITGWIGSNTEIEHQKKFTEELEIKVKERTDDLQNLNEELKKSNIRLDQFAYVASHDLQEPLRKIITFSLLLQDQHKDELSKNVKLYLNKIEGASSRMSTLISDMLNFSRLLQPEKLFVTTDLNEVLKNILGDFELLIAEKKAEIKIDLLPSITAIPLQMNQLFYNLISNALKYSKEDESPLITITSRNVSEKEIKKYPDFNPFMAYVEIIFKDNGIGFEQQYAERIFTIFQRLHDKETYIGNGIGLALCKTIIENHHGEIFAKAKENQGASFHVILPITQSRQQT
ncbi:MAG: chemotaxis protein CheB [Flavobacterium sp.]|uniref:chemotaxis protein CheB n=1 Tax=Flavobacterium sp. TaxID=239 RepID=UPI0032673DB7